MQNKIIWMTGGSGSGKSTAAGVMRSLGIRVVDADKVSHEVMEKGKGAYNEAVAAFGREILGQDGTIDRKKLAEMVFSDAEKLVILNEITHKYIKEELKRQAYGTVVFDAPLPCDGFIKCDVVLFIKAPPELRITRIMERDGITRAMARRRIASQISDDEYESMADAVIDSGGDIKEFENRVRDWCKNEKIN